MCSLLANTNFYLNVIFFSLPLFLPFITIYVTLSNANRTKFPENTSSDIYLLDLNMPAFLYFVCSLYLSLSHLRFTVIAIEEFSLHRQNVAQNNNNKYQIISAFECHMMNSNRKQSSNV